MAEIPRIPGVHHVGALPGGGTIHYARCEPCMYGSHPVGPHPWTGPEDVAHFEKQGLPAPTGQCACGCAQPYAKAEDWAPEPEQMVEIDATELAGMGPCNECGESGACSYGAEGRALIHVTGPKE